MAAATAMLVVSTAQPAAAAPAPYYTFVGNQQCRATYACAWWLEDYTGSAVGFYSDAWDWGAIPSAYRFINNNARSWENHGTSSFGNVRYFENPGGSGRNKCLKMGYSVARQADFNDIVSANVWKSTCNGYPLFTEQFPVEWD